MVSIYNPDYPGPVYCHGCYWGDGWDTLDFGRDFDFSRPFFEQYKVHRFTVPRITLTNSNSVNSEYTNQASDNKNCYMCEASNNNEYCLYGNWYQTCKECVDCWTVKECELLYECLDCLKCYKSGWLHTAVDCNDCFFGNDLRGCSNCFGCVNLRNKSYCWFNEQLTKEEYNKRLKNVDWSVEGTQKNYALMEKLRLQLPAKYYHGGHIVNSTGDYMAFNKNSHFIYNCYENENLKYGQDAWVARDSMDLTEAYDNTLDYEVEGTGWGQNNICTSKKWTGSDVYCSELTFSSDYLLGCVSMMNKKYCIFNKQYAPQEWKTMKDKIVAHMKSTEEWGEFFPVAISAFPYNDSIAFDYFPMTRDQVLAKGWRWYEKPKQGYKTGGDILGCENGDCVGVGAFKLHPTEVEFYKKMKLPLPIYCFPCRLKTRLARRNPRKLWKRNCMKCQKEIETSYAPARPEIVYCESCYNKEIA
ncbi:MAG: hypothetical protein AAB420_04070 [Patescibacteria group bacterium]